MNGSEFQRLFKICTVVLTITAFAFGCSKKETPVSSSTPAPTPAAPSSDPAATASTDPAQQAQQAPTGPVLDTAQMEGEAKRAMAEADAALRQKEYEKAVRTMLAIQQAQLNAQQAAAAHQQMIALQRNLANAIANGDPNAIAAGQILRAGHSR
jgi:hypothetical protein